MAMVGAALVGLVFGLAVFAAAAPFSRPVTLAGRVVASGVGAAEAADVLASADMADLVREGRRVALRYRVLPGRGVMRAEGRVLTISKDDARPGEPACAGSKTPTGSLRVRVAWRPRSPSEIPAAGSPVAAVVAGPRRTLVQWLFDPGRPASASL